MDSSKESDPNPMGFFENKNHPDPIEEGLQKIVDPEQRKLAKDAISSYDKSSAAATEKFVEKAKASQAIWEQKLNSMSERNPVRIVGEHVYGALQTYQNRKIGTMVLKSRQKRQAMLGRAQELAEQFRKRQAQDSRTKDDDRER